MRALVLCAGFGTRFRPATLTTPKPLLPFLGRPIVLRLLAYLRHQGVTSAVLNAHHLAEVLREEVGPATEGLPIDWSFEDPILGTAGAIRCAAERGLLPGMFFVVNGDLFTTLPLAPLRRAVAEPGVLAALAVLPNERPGQETPLWADGRGRLVSVGGGCPGPGATGPWLFTGIQLATPGLVARIPPGVAELARDVMSPSAAAADGAFALVPYRVPEDGFWFDLGSPERLARAEDEVARHAALTAGPPTTSAALTTRRPGSSPSPD